MLDLFEKPGIVEIRVVEQAFEAGDDTVRDIETVEPIAPFSCGTPALTIDDDFLELADIVGATRQGREALIIG